MTDRLNRIFEILPTCKIFADIGCDHGYIAKAMLDCKKAERVIISDISPKCLKKAEQLLSNELALGVAQSVVSDGFSKISNCDLALVAGMGGEEIVSILESAKALPDTLVLQPMKNADKVRVSAVNLGYAIRKDFIFKSSNKYYDLILLEKGKDSLSPEEIELGRTNLTERRADFIDFLEFKIARLAEYSKRQGLAEKDRVDMLKQMEKLKKYVEV